MSSSELIFDQAGATGLVAEKFRYVLARLDWQLGDVATAQKENVGKRLGDQDPSCPPQWADKILISNANLLAYGSNPAIFSSLRTEEASEFEALFARDRLVTTNSAANRMKEDVALASAFINNSHIDELFQQQKSGGRIIANGNCMSVIECVPLLPIHRALGIVSMQVETAQGWSGTGAREVPEGVDTISEIKGDERTKLETEPNRFLGKSLKKPADIAIYAKPRRAPWLTGHHVEIVATLAQETSAAEVQELWRSFRAPQELEAVKSQLKALSMAEPDRSARHHWPHTYDPIKPIKQSHGGLVRWGIQPIKLRQIFPMRVKAHLMEVSEADPHVIVIEAAGHNLMLGAVGGNLLNALYARAKGYI
jgi:aspartate-semialdehyde dehydrogenase